MGLFFGLIFLFILVVCYWVIGEMFFVGLVVFNVFLNLFNLLLIFFLDGGYILKSVSFLMNSKFGIVLCVLVVVGGVVLSYLFGLILFGFLLVMGMLEIVMEW